MGDRAPRRAPDHGSRTGLGPSRRAAASVAGLPGAIGNRAMARLASGSAPAAGGSRALALRSALRPAAPRRALARDLKKRHYVWKGKFDLDLTTESHAGAKNGMSGTIKFTPDGTGGDSTKIRLYQALRDYDLDTGADYVWTGGDAGRNSFRTSADAKRGVEEGWGIDINPAAATKRTKKTDKNVSPYYRDYWPNAAESQDGSKKGTTVVPASLWDYPGSGGNRRFSFETVAKAVDTGEVYGTVLWGFTISDASKGIVEKEYSRGRGAPTATTREALKVFNEYYANRGASTAPK